MAYFESINAGGWTSDKYAKEECCISLGVWWCIYLFFIRETFGSLIGGRGPLKHVASVPLGVFACTLMMELVESINNLPSISKVEVEGPLPDKNILSSASLVFWFLFLGRINRVMSLNVKNYSWSYSQRSGTGSALTRNPLKLLCKFDRFAFMLCVLSCSSCFTKPL